MVAREPKVYLDLKVLRVLLELKGLKVAMELLDLKAYTAYKDRRD
jgi:hypothetical protein